jgi:hypothetical protein
VVATPRRSTRTGAGAMPPPAWAKVSRIRLIRREVRETLSAGALDLLLEHAEVVIEGSHELGESRPGPRQVFATVMITIDLPRCANRFREPPDAATAERIAELLRDATVLRPRLVALARPRLAELAELAPDALDLSLEIHVRADGVRVLIDGDLAGWPRAHRRG